MKPGTSLYLDLVRFAAALTVFIEHLREHTKIGFAEFWGAHPFWFSHWYLFSQTAVTVFFVLSGYVIAHVLATRERTPVDYAASRFARLYSVVLPALLLTAVCNYLIELKYPTAFQAFQSGGTTGVALSYLGTAVFVNRFWLWPDLDPPNTPFWTLSFEAFYYLIIAILVFARGRGRILSMLVLILVAGPSMVLLAPTWLLGYLVYHLPERSRAGARSVIPLWLVSLAFIPLCSFIELHFRESLSFLRTPDHAIGALLAAYAVATCFAVNLLAFNAFSDRAEPFLVPIAAIIRWLGSMTFALYLFHQPILSLFTVYHVPDRSSAAQLVLLIGGTFLVVATLGRFCENTKGAYKRSLLAAWRFIASRAATLDLARPSQLNLASQLNLERPTPAVASLRRPGETSE
jgi:peptidoglycan/LPS O-acetylase OafA/YrhL